MPRSTAAGSKVVRAGRDRADAGRAAHERVRPPRAAPQRLARVAEPEARRSRGARRSRARASTRAARRAGDGTAPVTARSFTTSAPPFGTGSVL